MRYLGPTKLSGNLKRKVVHYGYIEKLLEHLGELFNIREISFECWGTVQFVQNRKGVIFTVVPFGHGVKDVSPPTKELMKLTLEQKLSHSGHPVLLSTMTEESFLFEYSAI